MRAAERLLCRIEPSSRWQDSEVAENTFNCFSVEASRADQHPCVAQRKAIPRQADEREWALQPIQLERITDLDAHLARGIRRDHSFSNCVGHLAARQLVQACRRSLIRRDRV